MEAPMPKVCAAVATALLLALPLGCGSKVNCDDLGAKLNRCKEALYTQMAPPPANLLDDLVTKNGPLAPEARTLVNKRWASKRLKLASRLADQITRRCTEHEGRFLVSEEVNNCLRLKKCASFAKCFAKVARKK